MEQPWVNMLLRAKVNLEQSEVNCLLKNIQISPRLSAVVGLKNRTALNATNFISAN